MVRRTFLKNVLAGIGATAIPIKINTDKINDKPIKAQNKTGDTKENHKETELILITDKGTLKYQVGYTENSLFIIIDEIAIDFDQTTTILAAAVKHPKHGYIKIEYPKTLSVVAGDRVVVSSMSLCQHEDWVGWGGRRYNVLYRPLRSIKLRNKT